MLSPLRKNAFVTCASGTVRVNAPGPRSGRALTWGCVASCVRADVVPEAVPQVGRVAGVEREEDLRRHRLAHVERREGALVRRPGASEATRCNLWPTIPLRSVAENGQKTAPVAPATVAAVALDCATAPSARGHTTPAVQSRRCRDLVRIGALIVRQLQANS